jgi:aminoglycoside 3-N-acetyltransferase
MVHSSLRAVGADHPETVVQALLLALGEEGTLLMPALSYLQDPPTVHDSRVTPSCVGGLTEYFRTRPGSLRSLHPTHSVSGVGARVDELLGKHGEDRTPCGPRSPFAEVLRGGKILMLGCGLRPNTAMHAVEEEAWPPYLFAEPCAYTITNATGRTFERVYLPHNFSGFAQRYERAAELLGPGEIVRGRVGRAETWLIDGPALRREALAALQHDPFFFVELLPEGDEG